mmetsp:Transcript_50372/g.98546  ORF Transcript_50372/g.98546 Transcript_50372/m.98546 type:complete len:295 (-) Transcript_50372:285-1169(-)
MFLLEWAIDGAAIAGIRVLLAVVIEIVGNQTLHPLELFFVYFHGFVHDVPQDHVGARGDGETALVPVVVLVFKRLFQHVVVSLLGQVPDIFVELPLSASLPSLTLCIFRFWGLEGADPSIFALLFFFVRCMFPFCDESFHVVIVFVFFCNNGPSCHCNLMVSVRFVFLQHVQDVGELNLGIEFFSLDSVFAREFHFERVDVSLVKRIGQVQPRGGAFLDGKRPFETVRRDFKKDVVRFTGAVRKEHFVVGATIFILYQIDRRLSILFLPAFVFIGFQRIPFLPFVVFDIHLFPF